jgi:chemotaxis methyl-accepting protein methylase
MFQSFLSKIAKLRIFGKSPVNAFLRLNLLIWKHLSPSLTTLRPIHEYGMFFHTLTRQLAVREQNFGTFFLRNRPELELICRLLKEKGEGSTLTISVLACSLGAEIYSILWTIRLARPDLKVILHAFDISGEILELAQKGVYSSEMSELPNGNIFERMSEEEIHEMFDIEGDQLRIKSWIKEGILWHLGDAGDPEILNVAGPQDIVVANRFLCHMNPPDAERFLRNIARLVKPCGYLFVSGIDLDVRTKVARDLGWKPVPDLMAEIHNGDPSLRGGWPANYWGLEPFNKRRQDWEVRYASVFQLGERV